MLYEVITVDAHILDFTVKQDGALDLRVQSDRHYVDGAEGVRPDRVAGFGVAGNGDDTDGVSILEELDLEAVAPMVGAIPGEAGSGRIIRVARRVRRRPGNVGRNHEAAWTGPGFSYNFV